MSTMELDDPIWTALTTEQAHLAERDGDAVRFAPARSPLAAVHGRGAAAIARLMQPGDVVVAVNDKPVDDTVDLINRTATIKPGENGRYKVMRGRDEVELVVKTGRRPPIEQQVRGR